jgi:hypothetical protein
MKTLSSKAKWAISILMITALIAGSYIFQPWKLFVDTVVQERIPTSQQSPESATVDSDTDAAQEEPENSEPILLAQGSLISHEHVTSGTVKILQLPDGTRVLRLEDLDTSDGPKVEVWLTDAPVLAGQDGWRVFDDGNYQSLGALKGNQGSQNYEIPADLDLSDFSSVSLWCVTFSVSFGAAELLTS